MIGQASFDDLGSPLAEVTFCVVDLETTGGSAEGCAITEIGAVKVRRGEVLGTFQTLVDPGEPVPHHIRMLTGIDDSMVRGAPPIETVLPAFLEFSEGCVIVAHNARFDMSFLEAACRRSGYPDPEHRVLDTAGLARKILGGEVPNRKLSTLAAHFRCAHQPSHRAYEDALATVDVLHHLIERVTRFGVTTLEDLLAVSTARMDGTFKKIELAAKVPKGIGIYRFHGHRDKVLYVGKATDLRSRVRSYFHGDARGRMRDMLREVQRISFERHPSMLEAEVAEAVEIARIRPPYNRAGKRTGEWFVKLPTKVRAPKFVVTRVVKEDAALYVGPMSSRVARSIVDALRDVFPLNRCAQPERCRGCAFGQLGTCSSGDRDAHRAELRRSASALLADHGAILAALQMRMSRLALQERYEEAAEARDKGGLVERVLWHDAVMRSFRDAGDVVLRVGDGLVLLRHGRLVATVAAGAHAGVTAVRALLADAGPPPKPSLVPTPEDEAAMRAAARWLGRNARDCRIVHVSGTWCMPARCGEVGRFRVERPERQVRSQGESR